MPRIKSPGRNTKLTDEKQSLILGCLRNGAYITTATAFAGISTKTFYTWLRRGARNCELLDNGSKLTKEEMRYADFAIGVRKASAESELGLLQKIQQQAANGIWTAAAWLLERRYPSRYGISERRIFSDEADIEKEDTQIIFHPAAHGGDIEIDPPPELLITHETNGEAD